MYSNREIEKILNDSLCSDGSGFIGLPLDFPNFISKELDIGTFKCTFKHSCISIIISVYDEDLK